jgi:hypothetical protein
LLTTTSKRLEEEVTNERPLRTKLASGSPESCRIEETKGGEKLGESLNEISAIGGVIGVAGALSGVLSAF